MAANCPITVVVAISLAVFVGLVSALPAEESESYYLQCKTEYVSYFTTYILPAALHVAIYCNIVN